MNIKIGRGNLRGNVNVISSKSDAHRLLIAAALADRPTQIRVTGWSEDLEATRVCLETLGCQITRREDGVTVIPIGTNCPLEDAVMNCRESGSTLRFLLPVAAALGQQVMVDGQGRLPERPIGVLLEELRRHGCEIQGESLPLVLEGGLQGGAYCLPGNISSQFITGLLFALPLLPEDSSIHLTTAMESRGYVDMTLETLRLFGIEIEEVAGDFHIKGGQAYHSPDEVVAEGDWSGAAFWIVAGAVGGDITCTGLRRESCQGDREIVPLMQAFGAEITWMEEGVHATGNVQEGISIDASQIPDLVPVLCAAAAFAQGQTKIYNAGRLRMKESDRLQAMAEGLRKLGVSVWEEPEGILVQGGSTLPEGEIVLDSFGDHRIVMSLAVAAAALGVEAVIEGAEAVNKSYPTFFSEFIRLGGVADVF